MVRDAICPQCGSMVVHRARRAGVIEHLLSTAYIYPFRCRRCLTRFRAMQWGRRYIRRTSV
jgi:hypothetical protein